MPGATPSPISTSRPSSAPTGTPEPGSSGSSAEIDIDLTGGDYEGSYRATAANGCLNEPAQNAFTVTYADDSPQKQFVALQLSLRDASAAHDDESSDYRLDLSLNGAGGGVSYTLDPAAGQGEGGAFLDVSEFDATVELSATAPDGAHIDLTVICDFGDPG
ncbi:MAG TPA: hypothetical protein VM284_06120 [Candidatus Limnocylindria bacterium]|nr:hypothetical protein [Candidatus Limnocylindria bacterium]